MKEGPCRGCSSPSYLPPHATVGLRGNRRAGRTRGGPWQAGNVLARHLTGGPVAQQACFPEVQYMVRCKGKFLLHSSKTPGFSGAPSIGKDANWLLQCCRSEEGYFPRICSGCWQHLSKAQKHLTKTTTTTT